MGLLGSDKLIIGYDLGIEYAQISFCDSRNGAVETMSQVAGEEKYNIPTALCKRCGVNQWFYGREALRAAEENQGVLVENLLMLALDGEPVIVDGETFDPVALLSLFFKRSLGNQRIGSMVITCPVLDHRAVEVLGQVVGSIQLKAGKVFIQGYGESFYSYMLGQPEELWIHQSVLFDYRKDKIKVYHLECNRRTRPIVVYIRESEFDFYSCRPFPEELRQEADAAFCRIAEEICGDGPVGSVYLIGDGFSENWMGNSLRFLCKGRRVFQGNNLFSKGACWGMKERLEPGEAGRTHVFLGKDKLKSNVGMRILRQGEESYYALLDAGVNWYEAEETAEFYLQGGNQLALIVTPLIWKRDFPWKKDIPWKRDFPWKKDEPGKRDFPGQENRGREEDVEKGGRSVEILLDGLPATPARINLHLFLESEDRLAVEVEDLGFGHFRAPSGRVWREIIDL